MQFVVVEIDHITNAQYNHVRWVNPLKAIEIRA
jgi:hypothetical protein